MATKYRIIIEASFGSEHQRDVAMRVVCQYLEGWKAVVEGGARKTK